MMYPVLCGALLVSGIIMNAWDRRMLLLTLLVGASVFVPAPHETAGQFYSFCIASEIAVGLVAWQMGGSAAAWVIDICVLLVISHLLGYALDGSLPFSPYRLLVKILEVSQLTVCVALSPAIAPILRNQDAPPPT